MTDTYNPQTLEIKVQQLWADNACFEVNENSDKPKYYSLCMFPYPSGQLHMGHVRNYTIGDVVMRYQRMQGKNVLQPMGWDAFGLPAENAAIKHNVHPAEWTYKNIEAMREQFTRLGFGYDWKRELTTCKPDYYRWEQWLFTRLFEKGLAYKKNAVVNWDPVDETVLANEQVVNGRGWRSGAEIERREISQWFLRITAYADELLEDLDTLTEWPEQVRTMQRNWIGRSQGAEVYFDVVDHDLQLDIFTTRVDTLMGATYIGVAAEHPLAKEAAKTNPELQTFIEECRHIKTAEEEIATMEKRGIATGFHAKHPLTGDLLPIWVANFVLMDYGTGAVMAVPAHDERDHEFAKKYNLTITQVLQPPEGESCDIDHAAYVGPGTLINSGEFDGLDWEEALTKIPEKLVALDHGEVRIQFRLRDWGVSRQRYWGTPIPIIDCDDCGSVAVPEKDLPVVLPTEVEFTGTQSPLKKLTEFYHTTCPKCNKPARRETDTFDTFVESSWYYARYASFNQTDTMLDERVDYWTPVDYYIGGVEHAVMHLLYARFLHKLLRDEGLLNSDEPFKKLLTQGMVLKDGCKMSKSKGNIVDPQALIDQYGADTVRLFMMFAASPDQSLEWSDSGVEGAYRYLKRVWQFADSATFITDLNKTNNAFDFDSLNLEHQNIRTQVHQILQQANQDMARSQFNTVVSAGMKLLNALNDHCSKTADAGMQAICQESFGILLRLLAPIVPHMTQHLWQHLGYGELIIDAPWPVVDKDALQTSTLELIVQVNGKLRGKIQVDTDADNKTIETAALANEHVQAFIADKAVKKVIVVPKRLVNLVVG